MLWRKLLNECLSLSFFGITDDTICSKTIPSSKAKHPIEAAGFHFSHLKRKQDYGHQAVAVLMSCNGITLPYDTILYDKSVSKLDIVKQIAEKLPAAPIPSYFLCDSWYVCEKLVDTFIRKGFYTVGAMKTNRILYPYGVKMNVCDFAGKLVEAECRELFHLVTVKQRQYYVYRHEGNLNGIENAVVLFTYPKNAFGKEKTLRAFISTNTAISNEEILNLYVTRWNIEVYFRDCKSKLAIDQYQIRSAKSIKRFWLIVSLVYLHDYVTEHLHTDKMTYIFLDEIQAVPDFQKAVDSLFIREGTDIYITGSNAHMLSGELATLLSGRYIEIPMLPLSFAEYLELSVIDKRTAWQNYFQYGGFPYAVQITDAEIRVDYLLGIYHTVLLKDVAARKRINDIRLLESVVKFLFDNRF